MLSTQKPNPPPNSAFASSRNGLGKARQWLVISSSLSACSSLAASSGSLGNYAARRSRKSCGLGRPRRPMISNMTHHDDQERPAPNQQPSPLPRLNKAAHDRRGPHYPWPPPLEAMSQQPRDSRHPKRYKSFTTPAHVLGKPARSTRSNFNLILLNLNTNMGRASWRSGR